VNNPLNLTADDIISSLQEFNSRRSSHETSLKTSTARELKGAVTKELILSLLDYTDLREKIPSSDLENVIKIITTNNSVAGLCVKSGNIVKVREITEQLHKNLIVVSVSGGFPTAYKETADVILSVEKALKLGADEVDIVLDILNFSKKNYNICIEKIKESKKLCVKYNAKLKVILETSELESVEDIKTASLLASLSGADFIKTSTGTTLVGASVENVSAICDILLLVESEYGFKIGVKPSGGISTESQCNEILNVIELKLGKNWLVPELTRIGASKLFYELTKMKNSKKHDTTKELNY
jgi:deoxyribose-phosphate aldolase